MVPQHVVLLVMHSHEHLPVHSFLAEEARSCASIVNAHLIGSCQ